MAEPEEIVEAREILRVLELTPDATMREVETAHRVLVRIWDPEAFPPGSDRRAYSKQKLGQIESAYQWICQHPEALKDLGAPAPTIVGDNTGFGGDWGRDWRQASDARIMIGKAVLALTVLLVVGVLILLTVVPPQVRMISGTVVKVEQMELNEFEVRVQVERDGSPPLRVSYRGRARLRVDQQVRLQESTTRILGGKRYRFKEPPDERLQDGGW